MNTSYNKYDSIEKLIFDEGLRIKSVEIDAPNDKMVVFLNRDVTFIVRLSYYKRLKTAITASLLDYRLIANGTGIHWPVLDEDLSLKGFIEDFIRSKIEGGEKKLVIA